LHHPSRLSTPQGDRLNFFKRSPPPPFLPPPKQNFHQRFQEDDLIKRSIPLGEFSSNPPSGLDIWTFQMHPLKKSTEVQTGGNSSMGPRIGDADTELWRGERIRNSPSEIYRPRNLPDPSGLLGLPRSAPAASPGHPPDSRGRPPSWAVPLGLGDWASRLRPYSRMAPLGPKPDLGAGDEMSPPPRQILIYHSGILG